MSRDRSTNSNRLQKETLQVFQYTYTTIEEAVLHNSEHLCGSGEQVVLNGLDLALTFKPHLALYIL